MGGGAFLQAYADNAKDRPNTPRMSPETYRKLKTATLDTLRKFLPGAEVRALIEAPGKLDYGDLDIFIAQEDHIDFVQLAKRLGATALIIHSLTKTTFAVDRDGNCEECELVIYRERCRKNTDAALPASKIEYAQLDINVITPDMLSWHTFYSSYGDLAGLLGRIVNPLGFTVSDRGLELRLEELDLSKTEDYVYAKVADPDGRILLSNDPHEVIEFFGCSVPVYETGFNTVEQLYAWLGASRLLSPAVLKAKRDNAHERRRESKRDVYSGFVKVWLPANKPALLEAEVEDQAAEILRLRRKFTQQAIGFFDKWQEYETRQGALTGALQNGLIMKLFKPAVAESSGKSRSRDVNEIIRAFHQHVEIDKRGELAIITKPHFIRESDMYKLLNDEHTALRNPDIVHGWISENWSNARDVMRAYEKQYGKLERTADV